MNDSMEGNDLSPYISGCVYEQTAQILDAERFIKPDLYEGTVIPRSFSGINLGTFIEIKQVSNKVLEDCVSEADLKRKQVLGHFAGYAFSGICYGGFASLGIYFGACSAFTFFKEKDHRNNQLQADLEPIQYIAPATGICESAGSGDLQKCVSVEIKNIQNNVQLAYDAVNQNYFSLGAVLVFGTAAALISTACSLKNAYNEASLFRSLRLISDKYKAVLYQRTGVASSQEFKV